MLQQPRVAVVDVFHDELDMYADLLSAHGFQVAPIGDTDVLRVVDMVAAHDADAVLTRILPGTFGIDLIRQLRRDVRTNDRPVVVITSLPTPALHEAARIAGANEVCLIPIDINKLSALIRQLVRRR